MLWYNLFYFFIFYVAYDRPSCILVVSYERPSCILVVACVT